MTGGLFNDGTTTPSCCCCTFGVSKVDVEEEEEEEVEDAGRAASLEAVGSDDGIDEEPAWRAGVGNEGLLLDATLDDSR